MKTSKPGWTRPCYALFQGSFQQSRPVLTILKKESKVNKRLSHGERGSSVEAHNGDLAAPRNPVPTSPRTPTAPQVSSKLSPFSARPSRQIATLTWYPSTTSNHHHLHARLSLKQYYHVSLILIN
ncbi:unnamed protein product [Gadus morhua 'NCC']